MYFVLITHVSPTYDVTSLKVNSMAYPKLRAGSELFLRAEVRDMSNEVQPLTDPNGGVTLTLRRPDGVPAVDAGVMTITATGIYTYFHQTALTDPTGVYRASFNIVEEDGTTVRTVAVDAFELVP